MILDPDGTELIPADKKIYHENEKCLLFIIPKII